MSVQPSASQQTTQASDHNTPGSDAAEHGIPHQADVITVPDDHPGIEHLLAVLACGELQAFYRLATEAQLSNSLEGRAAFAQLAAAEMKHFDAIDGEMRHRGSDIYELIPFYEPILNAYHRQTTPTTWAESLIKAYIGDALAADFYREIAASLPEHSRAVVSKVLAGTGNSQFCVAEVRKIVAADPSQKARLVLWARRLLSEAITQAQHVLASREELIDLLFLGGGDLNRMTDFFASIEAEHARRMTELGLQ